MRAGQQPGAGGARRAGRRQDGAAAVRGRAPRPGCRVARAVGRRVRDGARLRRACTSCARRCSTGSSACRRRSATRSRTAFGVCAAARPPIASWSGWRRSACWPRSRRDQPLLCVVDDAQWLDRASAQALAFVARRLLAESVGAACSRRASRAGELAGLPELVVEGLATATRASCSARSCAGRWTSACATGSSPRRGGNPLALLELPRGLHARPSWPAASGSGRAAALGPDRGELPPPARAAAGGDPAAAADRGGRAARRPALVWRAAARLGIGLDAAAPGDRRPAWSSSARAVRFRHPLVRSAVYRAASPRTSASAAHRALAEATDPDADPDRRAWHRAHAAPGPDEEVAAELERSAGRAAGARRRSPRPPRSSSAPTALTPTPRQRRAERALAAAAPSYQARRARRRAGAAGDRRRGPAGPSSSARRSTCCARQIAFTVEPRRRRAAAAAARRPAVRAARRRARRARPTWTRSPRRCSPARWPRGRRAGGRPRPPAPRPRRRGRPRAPDLLLDGLAVRDHRGLRRGRAAAQARRCARSAATSITPEEELRWLWLACAPRDRSVGRRDAGRCCPRRHLQVAREAGALAVLPMALSARIDVTTVRRRVRPRPRR